MWNELLEHYQKKSCLVDSNHWPTQWASYNSMLSAYHASRGSFFLHFSLLPWFASFLRKKNLFQKQSRPFPVEYKQVVISNFGMISNSNWTEWSIIHIPNRTFLVRFGSISGEFGRAMVRILARRSRAKIPMARPNERYGSRIRSLT